MAYESNSKGLGFSVLAGFKGSGLRNQASNYGVLAANRHFGITGVVLPTIVVAIPSVDVFALVPSTTGVQTTCPLHRGLPISMCSRCQCP